ncbi:hypothetical protein AMAG_18541 [Allomyces macrogynus ATCC 38327]|uniref:Uncharacterized protein n=1 Tax=Allomyces macrogynus (strain ATCC 38327) TaxID=578462 RepID=A0A0L0SDH9_ALLM3|nr:hypothetical protein AMAG_18541 [Allomyces macrogynus ATCC 38327]|eukprot:KNE60474.1 hypothetical protein AMAG_18541 [Allomyces macrogynus ATCC 38327]
MFARHTLPQARLLLGNGSVSASARPAARTASIRSTPRPSLLAAPAARRSLATSASSAAARQESMFTARNGLFLTAFTATMAGMTAYFLNLQRRKNLVMDALMFQIRTNPTLRAELGDNIDLAGWGWISGEINQMKGLVDIAFDVTGSTGKVAKVEVKMQRFPHDPLKWQTVDYFVSTKDKSWNGYVDDDDGQLVLKGGL